MVFRIAGRLDGPAAEIAGIGLRLLGAGVESLGRGAESATALTGADGTFVFLNVPAGAYTIIASRSVTEYSVRSGNSSLGDMPPSPGVRDYSMSSSAVEAGPAGTMITRHASEGDGRYFGRQSISVGTRDLTGIVVPLRPAVAISGRIVIEPASASTPAGGTPPSVAGAGILDLYAEPANGDPMLGMPRLNSRQRPTAQAPEFRLQGLGHGPYLLRTVGGPLIKSIVWSGKDHTYTPFDTTTEQDITGVVITLTNETTTVTGSVVEGSGQPAANTAVIAFPAERAQWTNFGIRPLRLRASAGSTTGAYTLRNLPAGDYLLVAVRDDQIDRRHDPDFLEAASRVATRLTIGWGETKTQSLTLREIK